MMTTTYRRAAARQFNRRAGGTASFRRIHCGATSRFTRPLVSGAGFFPPRASSALLRRRTPNAKVIVPGAVHFVRRVVSTEALLKRARRGNSSVQLCGHQFTQETKSRKEPMNTKPNMKKHSRRGSILSTVCAVITTIWMLGTIAKDYGSSHTPPNRCPIDNSAMVPDPVLPGVWECTTPWLHRQQQ